MFSNFVIINLMNLDHIFNYLYKIVPKETKSWLTSDAEKWLTCIEIDDEIKSIFSIFFLNFKYKRITRN